MFWCGILLFFHFHDMKNIVENKSKIYFIRGQSVMLDKDLSNFYGIETISLNKARKRKEDQFENLVFQLKKDEWVEILKIQGRSYSGGHLPWAYTEKGAYKMAFVLDSKTALKVSDTILDVFISVRDGNLVPIENNNKVLQLEMRIESLEKDMMGRQRNINNFNSPVTLVQGDHNNIKINSDQDLIMNLAKLLMDKSVVENKELTMLLSKSIDQANKKDKTGLMETLESIANIGEKVVSIAINVPQIILWVSKFL